MRNSPLTMGILYIILGIIFTSWGIKIVNTEGWGLFSYALLIIATLDIGGGIRLVMIHFKRKNNSK